MLGKHITLPLDRPEYIGLNEVFISSLAWRISTVKVEDKDWPGKGIGLVYDSSAPRPETIKTFGKDVRESEEWRNNLKSNGLETFGEDIPLSAIAESFRGAESKKGFNNSLVPLTPSLALCQNNIGALRRLRPPNVGNIIEQIYALGRTEDTAQDEKSAAGQWHNAMERILQRDSFLKVIDKSVQDTIFPKDHTFEVNPELSSQSLLASGEIPNGFGENTPFGWFRESWDLITSDDWVDSLPARRWVDWCLTILRSAYAFSTLWEMFWYDAIATSLRESAESDITITQRSLMDKVAQGPALLDWVDRTKPISLRSVTIATRKRIIRGNSIRKALTEYLNENPELKEVSADELFQELKGNEHHRDQIIKSRNIENKDMGGAEKNLWESVGYALRLRQDTGPYADHYSLLNNKESRNFSVVDPATEWVAVMSSISCKSAGSQTTLGDFLIDLGRLGLRPSKTELLFHLERAGLAKSSADADLAIEISSAY